jgi:probable rRNA maturation factor|tara:strand:+ start:118 stop:576 length:459 start_codon:yes stop_codon:yes gene_type:complete
MIKINVFSEETAWSRRLKKKEIFFKKICKSFPNKYKFQNKNVSISLMLSNNKNIRRLNKNFRKKNKPTDILSFPFNKKDKYNQIYLGDIIISYDYMDKPKSKNLNIFKEKVAKTFIHGFLHLLGYDHIKNNDYKKMVKEEERLFKSVISKIS